MIEVRNVHKNYGRTNVLNNLSLQLRKGEIVSVFGKSGAGKTSLLRIISGLECPDSGKLLLENSEYGCLDKKPYPSVNLVMQQFFLWPHLTVEQNIKIAIQNFDVEKNRLFIDLVNDFDLKNHLLKYPHQCSVGQKQRVAIVRALVLEPSYLLFDEITSALDIAQIAVVSKILDTLKSKKIGILLVSHNLKFILEVSSRVLFLDKGSIKKEFDKLNEINLEDEIKKLFYING